MGNSRILGIDPGSRTVGFGIVEQRGFKQHYVVSGCIRVAKYEWPQRLKCIFHSLSELIAQYQPAVAAIERIFVHKNVSSALKLGQARGVAMAAVACAGLSISEYAACEIKKAVVGKGGADKQQVQHMVQILLNLSGIPQVDAADALAIAICHGNQARR